MSTWKYNLCLIFGPSASFSEPSHWEVPISVFSCVRMEFYPLNPRLLLEWPSFIHDPRTPWVNKSINGNCRKGKNIFKKTWERTTGGEGGKNGNRSDTRSQASIPCHNLIESASALHSSMAASVYCLKAKFIDAPPTPTQRHLTPLYSGILDFSPVQL